MRIRVTKVQTWEFDSEDHYYIPELPLQEIRRIETDHVEDEGDRYFAGRGHTEIYVEQVVERQVA